jgi:hypothetical protein
MSKITVRSRETGTGGTGGTSYHDNEDHRGSDSVQVLQPDLSLTE